MLNAVEAEGVPADLGRYVASRFAQPKRGRPPLTQSQKEWRLRWIFAVSQLVERARFLGGLKQEDAVKLVAEHLHLSKHTILGYRKELHKARKGRFIVRRAEDVDSFPRRPAGG